jgi:peroxiredoxin
MRPTLLLLGCVLAPGQSPDRAPPSPTPAARGAWTLAPTFTRSQELVYRGFFTEECRGGRVQFDRSYRVEVRAFALDVGSRGAEVAFLTVLRPNDRDARTGPPPGVSGETPANSVRLEVVPVSPQGRLLPPQGVKLQPPLEGVPTIECDVCVEAPEKRVGVEGSWDVADEGRPPLVWRVAGAETMAGVACVKVVGVQQSDDWEHPRADRTAWRRQETLWLAARTGLAQRVERVIERRAPAHNDVTYVSKMRYDLDTGAQYPGELSDDRRLDIREAQEFAAAAAPLLPQPARYNARLGALANKINAYLERYPARTPYREAVLLVKRRVEAGLRGETPPAAPQDPAARTPVAGVGQTAPDFVATDFTSPTPARLQRWRGHPVLLVFYKPNAETAGEVLTWAQRLAGAHPGAVTVVGMAVCDDAEKVLKQRAELKLTFPVVDGSALYGTYGIEATPKCVLIDADGVVRGSWLGWGEETPAEILAELKRTPGK